TLANNKAPRTDVRENAMFMESKYHFMILKKDDNLEEIRFVNRRLIQDAVIDALTVLRNQIDQYKYHWPLLRTSRTQLKVMEIIRSYEAASNARVNRSKTMLIPLTVIARVYNLTSECNFRNVTKDEPISILGHKEELAHKIQNKINSMANRNLSFKELSNCNATGTLCKNLAKRALREMNLNCDLSIMPMFTIITNMKDEFE
ncbi:2329_t:CDS:2, partial [Gigaspora rosea]